MASEMPYKLKICPECGKEFLPARLHAYRTKEGFYCSNHCYEKAREGVRPYRRLGGEANGNKHQ